MQLTVLYDDHCPLCRTFSSWLARQPTLVDLDLLPAGSGIARSRFPTLTVAARQGRRVCGGGHSQRHVEPNHRPGG